MGGPILCIAVTASGWHRASDGPLCQCHCATGIIAHALAASASGSLQSDSQSALAASSCSGTTTTGSGADVPMVLPQWHGDCQATGTACVASSGSANLPANFKLNLTRSLSRLHWQMVKYPPSTKFTTSASGTCQWNVNLNLKNNEFEGVSPEGRAP